jgi:hypothetical protein
MRRFVFAALLLAPPASAATPQDKQACIAASEKAQHLRADSKLTASREQLLSCARDACPAVIRKDCARWLAEVDEALPSIVLGAKDNEDHDVTDVKVTVDKQLFAERLDGKAQPIDPGTHVFTFERAGESAVTETVLVREGEKNRMVSVKFVHDKPTAVDPVRTEKKISPAAWIFGGVGVVAFTSFAYFGLSARSRASDLRSSCAPACADDDVSSVRSKLLIADLSLAISLVSFGAATYFFLNPTETRAVALSPLPGGAALQIAGRF